MGLKGFQGVGVSLTRQLAGELGGDRLMFERYTEKGRARHLLCALMSQSVSFSLHRDGAMLAATAREDKASSSGFLRCHASVECIRKVD